MYRNASFGAQHIKKKKQGSYSYKSQVRKAGGMCDTGVLAVFCFFTSVLLCGGLLYGNSLICTFIFNVLVHIVLHFIIKSFEKCNYTEHMTPLYLDRKDIPLFLALACPDCRPCQIEVCHALWCVFISFPRHMVSFKREQIVSWSSSTFV